MYTFAREKKRDRDTNDPEEKKIARKQDNANSERKCSAQESAVCRRQPQQRESWREMARSRMRSA